MTFQVKITKKTILLVVAAILAMSVCFTAVNAWLTTQSTATATVTAQVINFNFTANGKFNQNFSLTPGASQSATTYTYAKSPAGMYPGQKIEAKIYLNNGGNLDAIYMISCRNISSNLFPSDCLVSLVNDSNQGSSNTLYKNYSTIYPTSACSDKDAANTSYAYLAKNSSRTLTLTIEWPLEYSSGVGAYASADAKNSGDLAFLNTHGDRNMSFAFQISAEQKP